MDYIINFMKSGKELNSWNAKVHSVIEEPQGLAPDKHQVNTDNVDQRAWNPNVTMYL